MSDAPEVGFELDPRLAGDTAFVADWPLCRVLLMDDARFPWLVLVPRRARIEELDDLQEDDQTALRNEINRALALLRRHAPCDKCNVGALGNIVRQLHIHVVARRTTDAAWPGPVWSHGKARPYLPEARDQLITALRRENRAVR